MYQYLGRRRLANADALFSFSPSILEADCAIARPSVFISNGTNCGGRSNRRIRKIASSICRANPAPQRASSTFRQTPRPLTKTAAKDKRKPAPAPARFQLIGNM
ncbi:hypothetical protein P3342_010913 [Pyrenophora teres f. teres]|nr:hypothetical protein P3342_010913 [Pyrenophora teres f. teres]